jgi:hypothetical protein
VIAVISQVSIATLLCPLIFPVGGKVVITIKHPHMGLNDERAPVFVQMWNTWRVKAADTKRHIIDWTAKVARDAPGGKLAEIVISCHGAPAYLQLGEGIGTADTDLFRGWRGLVEKIWLRACFVGRIVGPSTPSEGDGAFIAALSLSGDGHRFCSEVAKAAQCYLVVGTELQSSRRYSQTAPVPYGQLDSYEGLVLSYHPDGTIGWSRRYASVYNANATTLTAVNPNDE